jgi:hypothetical protein
MITKVLLKQSGFTDFEIKTLLRSKIDIDSLPFRLMIDSRKQYVEALKGEGLTLEEIHECIAKYYKAQGRHPLDFYHVECNPCDKRWQL